MFMVTGIFLFLHYLVRNDFKFLKQVGSVGSLILLYECWVYQLSPEHGFYIKILRYLIIVSVKFKLKVYSREFSGELDIRLRKVTWSQHVLM